MSNGGHGPHVLRDQLSLWTLTVPTRPVRVGVVSLALNGQGVALGYDPAWLRRGYAFSEDEDTPLIEHAAMTWAARCGIDVAETRALPLRDRHAVAVRRFDRIDGGARVHAVSAHVALRAVGEAFGDPQLVQQLRRLRRAEDIARQQIQLCRRMVFDILVDNTDDHERNHALLRQADGHWTPSPAFDIVPSLSGPGYQAMAVGRDDAVSTLDNAGSEAAAFGLEPAAARAIVRAIATTVQDWRRHFEACGVKTADPDMAAQCLDNDRLGAQRRAHATAHAP